MNYIEAVRLLEAQEFKNIFFVFGEEEYLTDFYLQVLKRRWVESSLESLNYSKLHQKEAPLETLITDCETLPFMSEYRVIEIEEVGLSKEDFSKNKAWFEDLEDYLPKIPKTTLLIFKSKSHHFFKGRFQKKIAEISNIVEMNRLTQQELFGFIQKFFHAESVSINSAQIHRIMDRSLYIGKDSSLSLYELKNNLEKLIYRSGKVVEEDVIDEIFNAPVQESIFKYLDALTKRDLVQSMTILQQFKKEPDDAFMVFHMVVRQFRNLFFLKSLFEKDYSDDHAKKQTGLSPYEFKKMKSWIHLFSVRELKKIYLDLYSIEERVKNSRGELFDHLIYFTIAVCTKK